MQRLDQRAIDLQQRLAAGHHDKAVRAVAGGPLRFDLARQRVGIHKPAAQRAVGADKIRVAKPADGARPVLLAA